MDLSEALPAPLTESEALTLAVTKLWMMQSECAQDDDVGRQYLKRLITDQHLVDTASRWGSTHGAPPSLEAWHDLLRETGPISAMWGCFASRERALLILLELAAFSPWGPMSSARFLQDKPASTRRRHVLHRFATNTSGLLDDHDADNLDEKLQDAIKKLDKRPVETMRRFGVAGIAAIGGVAAGAWTGGLAAPAIGSAIGGALELSGAAATNAGLALLGGGSLASGGLGMAGGVAVVMSTAGAVGGMAGGMAAGYGWSYLDAVSADELLGDSGKLLTTVAGIVLESANGLKRVEVILDHVRKRRDEAHKLAATVGGAKKLRPNLDGVTRKVLILDGAVKHIERLIP